MIASIVASFVLAGSPLSPLESRLVLAIKNRNVERFLSFIDKRVNLFTIINGNALRSKRIKSELPESYLVAIDMLTTKTGSGEIKLGLERLSRIVAISLDKGQEDARFKPQRVKSRHNDLTAHTIRGLVRVDDYWELHYRITKTGKIVLDRVCEFDNASKFMW